MKKSWQRREFIKTSAFTGLSLGILGNLSIKAGATNTRAIQPEAGKRIGIIGLDTSHATAFTKSFNSPDVGNKYNGYRVVAAYPQGSYEIESSYKRIPAITAEVKSRGVEIVGSIKELLNKVDVVLLETNDGRLHKEQAFEVINARKPVFIDKPMANSTKDVIAIFNHAEQNNVPVFSSSSLRFSKDIEEVVNGKAGNVLGADMFSPSPLEKTHTDFFWYGIHGVEMLFTVMGAGCESVTRFYRDNMDVVVGTWKDGRIGTFRGLRTPKQGYGGQVYGDKQNVPIIRGYSYDDLLAKVVQFFDTGVSPVPKQETIEIAAFIDASQKSRKQKGKRVSMLPYMK